MMEVFFVSEKKSIEEIIKENEEIDSIIVKMSKGEKVKCPKCGEILMGNEQGKLKSMISCPNKDFEVLLDFKSSK